jgi:hypothetical protein
VVQIINNLDPGLLFDPSKTYEQQKKSISKKLLSAIKTTMNPSLKPYDTETLKIVKQLHKSRRELWRIDQAGNAEQHKKDQRVTSRRDQVFH